ncbi:unnamed protein product [Heligmosomoides polygyrus]|uniref:Reverse transcriptase domain-containing protein n=1 Tax=Heligmosomoides polygyrus TaxID=6339 RepID=A0A183FK96_HELPZ|nr:unnamed protein product [Heligmosomoides polygyrus]
MTKSGRREIEKQAWLWTTDVRANVREKERRRRKRQRRPWLLKNHYDNLSDKLETKDIGKFLGVIDENDHLLTNGKRALRRWHDYFEGISTKITVEETEEALKKMKPGKSAGPDDIAADSCLLEGKHDDFSIWKKKLVLQTARITVQFACSRSA